ncbi:MAG: FAD-dependent oxidoreductase [Sphingobacteriia bacterium]|nr:FAD-dependent oxidoreductase [Sphingobacteriia bacterium]
MEIRYINPPRLEVENIGDNILCYRPKRRGEPRINIIELDNKIILNNYGQGGAGWTIAPGAANYLVNSFIDKYPNVKKNEPIAVIGAGVKGLFTTIELLENGFKNIIIYAEEFDNLASHNAGASFAPPSSRSYPTLKDKIAGISIYSYNFYKSIVEKKHTFLKSGARIIPAYYLNKRQSPLERYVREGIISPAKEVILDFKNGKTYKMFAYDDCIFIETAQIMDQLNSFLKKKEIIFNRIKINSFNKVKEKIIVNAAGIGAKELLDDKKMLPVQGHLVMLKNQNPENLNYTIFVDIDEKVDSNGNKYAHYFYIFPKSHLNAKKEDIGVLGGTFIENADSTTPNFNEFQNVIENAKIFFGLL